MPRDGFRDDLATRVAYSYDNSRRRCTPAAVLFPEETGQVVKLVRACGEHGIPVTARGLGSATTGSAVPASDGVVVSFERMARILEVNPADRLMVVQPGVLNAEVQRVAAGAGFFWAPDPTSAPYSTIGGNIACHAAGPRAVKYGTTRENILGLEVVTGAGDTIRTGTRTTKGVVGYDLTRLFIGSEGTLALTTEATLKLTPLQHGRATIRALYHDVDAAARAVAAIMAGPVTPCALEFMDGTAIQLVGADHLGGASPEEVGALLLIELEGEPDLMHDLVESVSKRATVAGTVSVDIATDAAEAERLWDCRRALSPAQRRLKPHKINEDVAVPVSVMPALVKGLADLADHHGILILSFGHAGNGNLHVNLLGDDADLERRQACLVEVFRLVLDLGGTLSAEHGIGSEKRMFVEMELGKPSLAAMRALKRVFDPAGILNPGTLFPDD
jgi:D-lactate dehydrogenase (quinone)